MSKNYFVWGAIASCIENDEVLNEVGEFVVYSEGVERRRRRLIALRKFYSDNDLLRVRAFDDSGVIDREYYFNDFTEEGVELLRRKESAWLKSKGSSKNPPDMSILEKALAEIRAAK
uniref:hypothetical protein n=1 Tax=Pseudomonas laurentiana TaxID=2364649 RepID=UPI0029C78657|nr:hypothetical protein [Pseudomonas laurentiana]